MPEQIMTIFHMSDIHIGEPGVDAAEFRRVVDEIVENQEDDKSNSIINFIKKIWGWIFR